jgi:sortase A
MEEIRYAYNNFFGRTYAVAEDIGVDPQKVPSDERTPGFLSQILAQNTVQPLIPEDPAFSIIIPKIGANENVVPMVDPGDEKVYLAALQKGVAHAAGTAFPGENRHVYLFAHSTNTFSNVSRYNAVFYLLYKLESGDEINVYYQGIRHIYKVVGKSVVNPAEVNYLTKTTQGEFLTLQTCWPPGTTAQRMLVFAEPVSGGPR